MSRTSIVCILLLHLPWLVNVAEASEQADDPLVLPEIFKKIDYQPLNELSGLVKSKRFPNLIWAHNDSGDSARLFALNTELNVIFPSFLERRYYTGEPEEGQQLWPGHLIHQAVNLDWEDIAVDENHIYVADTGNNGNARRDMGVYVIAEPNPRAVAASRPLRYLPIAYPEQENFPAEQWHYDNEAIYMADGHLYFLTKRRKPGKIAEWDPGTSLYRLETDFTDRFNILKKVDEHSEVHVVTAADVSPDGKQLAVLGYTQVWIFDKKGRRGHWLSGNAHFLPLNFEQTGQVEALCWVDDATLLIGNEEGQIFRLSVADIPPYQGNMR